MIQLKSDCIFPSFGKLGQLITKPLVPAMNSIKASKQTSHQTDRDINNSFIHLLFKISFNRVVPFRYSHMKCLSLVLELKYNQT